MDGQEDSMCVRDDATLGDDHAVEDLRQLVINRPGVSGAVLHTASSLIN